MKLKSVLKSLDAAQLRAIRDFWELPGPSAAKRAAAEQEDDVAAPTGSEPAAQPEQASARWVKYLYPRLQNASHFQSAFQRLGQRQRDLVCFLAVHGGNMDEKELRKRLFPGARDEMKATLAEMRERGFVFVERWTDLPGKPTIVGIPEPYLRFVELPHVWQNYAGRLLRELPIDHLQKIATNGLGLKLNSSKRDRLIYLVRNTLTDPDRLRGYIDSLPEDQREVLFLALQRRGVCLYRDMADVIQGRRPDLGKSDPIERLLLSSGLVFLLGDNASKYQNLLRVPRDVYYIITHHFVRDQRGLAELDAISHCDPDQQPKIIYDNGIAILRDIVIFVGFVERHTVRRLGNGGIGKNDLKKILPRLSKHKTLKYAQFLAFYCIRKRFLVPTNNHWAVSSMFRAALRDSRAFYGDLYATWFQTTEWNEEYIDGDCFHTDHYPNHLINIVELRKLVLKNLSEIPFDTWIDGPRFVESLLVQIEVHIPHRGSKTRLDKDNRINYLVIESILCESLYWLGFISLGLREETRFDLLGGRGQEELEGNGRGRGVNGGARLDRHFNFNPRPLLPESYHFHFQINGLGRSILKTSLSDPAKIQDPKTPLSLPFRDDMLHFTVLPNLDVVAPPDLNLQRFYQLRQFAQIRHIDVMSILAITLDSVRAALDNGMKGEQILAFLEDSCPKGLPETVRHLINECSSRHGEISIGYAGGYIRVSDPLLLENLRNNKILAPLIKDVFENRLVLLNRDADVHHVARELKRLGFMPCLDSENVYTTSGGRLRFSLAPDDLGVLIGILEFVLKMEEEMDASVTEEKARPLLHSLEPANHAQLNLNHFTEVLSKQFERNFEAALKKKLNAVANRYRRQMREFIEHSTSARTRPAYPGANPATKRPDIRKLLKFAIERESEVELSYVSTTKEETQEKVRPESLDGDKLHAFSEDRQTYCAYRLSRVLSARLN